MKLMIAGSRTITDFNLENYISSNVDLIICGGAKGIDTIAECYADKNKISKLILRPKYNLYGRGAPLKRNEEMIKIADEILVFWDGKSNGTKYTMDKAKELRKPITVITVN